jgi:hypothetical protein
MTTNPTFQILFEKYTSSLQKILAANISEIRKAFFENFKENPDKPFILLKTDLKGLMKIVTDMKAENFSTLEECISYVSSKNLGELGIPENQVKMITKFDKEVRIHHVVIHKDEKTGAVMKFQRTYLLYEPKGSSDTSGKIYSYKIEPKIKEELKVDKSKRGEWIRGLKEKIRTDLKQPTIKFAPAIEEWFTEFIEDFKFEKRSFIIEGSLVCIWE